jgi:hypothetical protein
MAKITVKALNKIAAVGPNLRDLMIDQGIIKPLLSPTKLDQNVSSPSVC